MVSETFTQKVCIDELFLFSFSLLGIWILTPGPNIFSLLQAEAVSNLPTRPTDNELLELYGLYKQATVGDNNTEKPGMFDSKGKYKWEHWEKLKGTPQEEAEQKYIALVDELLAKYSS